MNILTGNLDSLFQSEIIDEACTAYSKLTNFKINEDEDISDYIIEYDYLYKRMINFDKLPDPVLTFKLLEGANLTDAN